MPPSPAARRTWAALMILAAASAIAAWPLFVEWLDPSRIAEGRAAGWLDPARWALGAAVVCLGAGAARWVRGGSPAALAASAPLLVTGSWLLAIAARSAGTDVTLAAAAIALPVAAAVAVQMAAAIAEQRPAPRTRTG